MTLDEHIAFFTELKQYMEFFSSLEDSHLVANVEYKLAEVGIDFNVSYSRTEQVFRYNMPLRDVQLYPEVNYINRLFALKLLITLALGMLTKHKSQTQC